MKIYSVLEASEKTNIPPRSISYYCKRDNVRKKSNKYQITDVILNQWIKEKNNKPKSFASLQDEFVTLQKDCETLQKENASLQAEIGDYQAEILRFKEELTKDIPHQQKLKEAIQLITLEALEQNVQHKIFTEDEYQDLIGTISEVDFQKEQVNYLRKRVEKQDAILTELVKQSTQSIAEKRERNHIEARDKNLI